MPFAATIISAAPVLAHAGHDVSFGGGLAHPFLGVDHVLAMAGVGALAALWRRPVALPTAFVGAMALGGVLALVGVAIPGAEIAVATSVVAIACALLAGRAARTRTALVAVALAGVVHGFVHGADASGGNVAGFLGAVLASTVALHALGAGAGLAVRERHTLRRVIALAVLAAGAGLVAAAVGA